MIFFISYFVTKLSNYSSDYRITQEYLEFQLSNYTTRYQLLNYPTSHSCKSVLTGSLALLDIDKVSYIGSRLWLTYYWLTYYVVKLNDYKKNTL